jgi:hypothetical protein
MASVAQYPNPPQSLARKPLVARSLEGKLALITGASRG